MKIIQDLIYSEVHGTEEEINALHDLLLFEEGSFISYNRLDDGRIVPRVYTGLTEFIYDHLSGMFQIEIDGTNNTTKTDFDKIKIDEDYLHFNESDHKLRTYQMIAVKKAIHHGRGVIEASTGCLTGDTVISVSWLGVIKDMFLKDLVWMFKNISTPILAKSSLNDDIHWHKLAEAYESGIKPVYLLKTVSGHSIKATCDHKFKKSCIVKGSKKSSIWCRLGNLKVDDSIYVESSSATDVILSKIVSIDYVGEEMTYDLAMDGEPHNFIANGFMVHNSGKTECAACLIKYYLENDIVDTVYFIVGTGFLMEQAFDRFSERLADSSYRSELSMLSGTHAFNPKKRIQICVVNSVNKQLIKKDSAFMDHFNRCGLLIYDEMHHLAAKTWIKIGETCPAPHRFGMTATVWSNPFEYSYEDLFLLGILGNMVCNIPSKFLRKLGYLADPYVTMFSISGDRMFGDWQSIYKEGIVLHKERNSIILSVAQCMAANDYTTLIFVSRIAHGLALVRHLYNMGVEDVIFVKGQSQTFQYKGEYWDKKKLTISEIAEWVKERPGCIMVGNCLHGDTKIKLLDGTSKTICDLAKLDNFDDIYVYSCDSQHNIVPGKVKKAWLSKKNVRVYSVVLDNGEVIRATENHPFMLRCGSYRKLKELKPGDSLMPMYSGFNRHGYINCYNPATDKYANVHQLVAKLKYGDDLYKHPVPGQGSWVIHHKDLNKLNNNPSNLVKMTWKDHSILHAKLVSYLHTPEIVKRKIESYARWAKSPEGRESFSRRMKKNWKDPEYRKNMQKSRELYWNSSRSNNFRKKVSKQFTEYNLNTSRVGSNNGRYHNNIVIDDILKRMSDPNLRKIDLANELGVMSKVIDYRIMQSFKCTWNDLMKELHGIFWYPNKRNLSYSLQDILDAMGDPKVKRKDILNKFSICRKTLEKYLFNETGLGYYEIMDYLHDGTYHNSNYGNKGNKRHARFTCSVTNHKVINIIDTGEVTDVYDLEVDKYHNFALDAGVFVHNSVIDEGIDIPEFNSLIMATGMQKYRRTIQRVGRGMRPKKDNRVYIFDFWDHHSNMLKRHSKYRNRTYIAEEHNMIETLDQLKELSGCEIVIQNNIYSFSEEDYKTGKCIDD